MFLRLLFLTIGLPKEPDPALKFVLEMDLVLGPQDTSAIPGIFGICVILCSWCLPLDDSSTC